MAEMMFKIPIYHEPPTETNDSNIALIERQRYEQSISRPFVGYGIPTTIVQSAPVSGNYAFAQAQLRSFK